VQGRAISAGANVKAIQQMQRPAKASMTSDSYADLSRCECGRTGCGVGRVGLAGISCVELRGFEPLP
jgi:hypothetical protein